MKEKAALQELGSIRAVLTSRATVINVSFIFHSLMLSRQIAEPGDHGASPGPAINIAKWL